MHGKIFIFKMKNASLLSNKMVKCCHWIVTRLFLFIARTLGDELQPYIDQTPTPKNNLFLNFLRNHWSKFSVRPLLCQDKTWNEQQQLSNISVCNRAAGEYLHPNWTWHWVENAHESPLQSKMSMSPELIKLSIPKGI